MAGRFRIFNEPSENVSIASNKGREQLHSFNSSKIKTTGAAGLVPSKSTENLQFKPKGLSVRSKSDLNVFVSSNFGTSKQISKSHLKVNEKQDHLSKKLSPLKLCSPKNVADEFVFKKPATPIIKKNIETPEPEQLAFDFDVIKYMDDEMKAIYEADLAFVRAVVAKHQSKSFTEDEGFYSDSEAIPWETGSDSLPYMNSSACSDLSDITPPTLPELSDSDDE
ncbi:hypothetical protein QAD02_004972 [Eretmocerus hayati]|uniref:Uncharacterized protein n=1 Tax=Eretmocerus hayati TaxID=131215 RepID=A0ACC2NVX8_9HYME|nr:hypothetical protein QAD02_004972 [Eretmocerus hayati]